MQQFEIFWVDLDPTVGAEMKKLRPYVIVSPDDMNDYIKTLIVAPITSTQRSLPTRVLIKASAQSGLKNDSYAALDQIKTIDKSRVSNKTGEISEEEKHAISETLKEMFDY
ncbi:MAG: type II toxin-antitoxin system PemK/MazF family toxin [Muribaculaceae bacterium]|nr:type II toxin-antitoxin system PemK/MazF family toxin [Muribaculaceae bacterium]